MRLMPNVAASVSGKIIDAVPIVEPVTFSVSGPSAAAKMMNGIGRMILTSTLRIV